MGANRVGQSSDIVDFDRSQRLIGIKVLAQFDILLELRTETARHSVVAAETLVSERRKTEIRLPKTLFLD